MTWLRLDVRIERAPDLVVRAEPSPDGRGWSVRGERSTGCASAVIHGFLARLAPAMNIFGIELPAKIIALLALLAATMPFLVGSVHAHIVDGLGPFLDLIREMAPR